MVLPATGETSRTRHTQVEELEEDEFGNKILPTPFKIHVTRDDLNRPKAICRYPEEHTYENALNLAFFEAFLDLDYFTSKKKVEFNDSETVRDTLGNGQYAEGATWFDHDENSFDSLIVVIEEFLKRKNFKFELTDTNTDITFEILEETDVTMNDPNPNPGTWKYPNKRFRLPKPKGGIFGGYRGSPMKKAPKKLSRINRLRYYKKTSRRSFKKTSRRSFKKTSRRRSKETSRRRRRR